MPRKKKEIEPEEKPSVQEIALEDVLADRFSRYSKYIIQERALPDARDGLKPVQRRILWAMYEDGNTASHGYRKSAKTVGNVIGNYHPHGDSSVYDALVRLSQDWKIRAPLVDMQGNNGSIDDDPAAAMRYTEARLAPITDAMMEDIEKDTVEWAPNFSDEKMEPITLPVRFPHLLVNGSTGIAAGYATNIPPHNLEEVIDAAIYRLNHPSSTLDDLMNIIPGPDFPTGAIAMGKDGIRQAFETGKGRIVIRSKAQIEEQKTVTQIVVTEIPYEVVKSNMVRRIDEIRINHTIDGILDVRDESDRNGLRIVIDLKKEANAQAILNYLYKNTDLQISYTYNMVAIVHQTPVWMGLIDMLDAFLEYREQVVISRSRYQLDAKEKRAHIVEGLIQAVSILDDVIRIIRASKNKADSKKNLMEAYAFSEAQAEAIVTLQLYRLSNTDLVELQKEAQQLDKEINILQGLIKSSARRHTLMIKEMEQVKAGYATPRKTKLVDELQEIRVDEKDMIADEQMVITISHDGYAKRVSLRSWSSSQNTPTGRKEGDWILGSGQFSTLDTLMVVTNRGRLGRIPLYKLDEARWKDIGSHLSTLIKLEPSEKIAGAWIVREEADGSQLILASKRGYIKRLDWKDLPATKGSRLATVMKLASQDALSQAFFSTDPSDDVVLISQSGYGLRYSLDQIPQASAKTKGVKGIHLDAEDVLQSALIPKDKDLLLEADRGFLKREAMEDVPRLKRPARGNRLYKISKSSAPRIEWARSVSIAQTLTLQAPDLMDVPVREISKTASTTPMHNALNLAQSAQPVESLEVVSRGFWQPDEQEYVQDSLFDAALDDETSDAD